MEKERVLPVHSLFENLIIDENVHRRLIDIEDTEVVYIIAITPRSGSSYLASVMRKSKLMGTPGEFLPPVFMKNILQKIPARCPDEYLRNVLRKTQTKNKVSGLKTSWFQFQQFLSALNDQTVFYKFKYIYLYRRDIVQQAVSLYKATESNMFHTNIEHSSDTLQKVKNLEYSYEKIKKWKKHIEQGELEWQNFFLANNIYPLRISYEEIDSNIDLCINSISTYLGVNNFNDNIVHNSVFKKMRDRKSLEYSCKFMLELYDRQG